MSNSNKYAVLDGKEFEGVAFRKSELCPCPCILRWDGEYEIVWYREGFEPVLCSFLIARYDCGQVSEIQLFGSAIKTYHDLIIFNKPKTDPSIPVDNDDLELIPDPDVFLSDIPETN